MGKMVYKEYSDMCQNMSIKEDFSAHSISSSISRSLSNSTFVGTFKRTNPVGNKEPRQAMGCNFVIQ